MQVNPVPISFLTSKRSSKEGQVMQVVSKVYDTCIRGQTPELNLSAEYRIHSLYSKSTITMSQVFSLRQYQIG